MSLSRAAQSLARTRRRRVCIQLDEMPTRRFRRERRQAAMVVSAVCFALLGVVGFFAALWRAVR